MTATEINRRVAEALGCDTAYEQVRSGRTGAGGLAIYSGDPLDFSRDPADADLVRQEIERRGWEIVAYNEVLGEGRQWQAFIRRHDNEEWLGFADSGTSPHEALCLAFLAACEASKEEK